MNWKMWAAILFLVLLAFYLGFIGFFKFVIMGIAGFILTMIILFIIAQFFD